MQHRKDEIQAKKAKLAELKRQRELRQSEFAAGRQSLTSPPLEATSPRSRPENRQELDSLISSLVGEATASPAQRQQTSAAAAERYPRLAVAQHSGQVERDRALGPPAPVSNGSAIVPQKLSFTRLTTLYEIKGDPPKREVITYSKGIQTSEPWTRSRSSSLSDSDVETRMFGERPPMRSLSRRQREREDKLRQDVRSEVVEELRAQQQSQDGTHRDHRRSKQEKLPTLAMTKDEMDAVTSSYEFLDFVERTSKVAERALDEEYNVLADYRLDHLNGDDDEDGVSGTKVKKGRRVREVIQFYDERWSKKRMITDLGFSPKYPELVLASYTKSSSAPSDPDGLIHIWNLHMHDRPEYMFHATSDILTAKFSPFHPNLVLGGCYTGQVLMWDTRSRSPSPVQQTSTTGLGHSHPIYSLNVVGTQNANNIVTTSTDGVVCSWAMDMLSNPQQHLTLRYPTPTTTTTFTRTPFAHDIAPTCTAFPPAQTTYFLAGTEQGPIELVHRHDRAGAPAGIDTGVAYRAHAAPVMSLDFHNAAGPHNLGDLMLSTGLDWSVKLWRVRTPAASVVDREGAAAKERHVRPLLELQRDEAVYDARWSPARPGVFACVDGGGWLEVWDLNDGLEVPVARERPAPRGGAEAGAGLRGAEATGYGSMGGMGGGGAARSLNKCAWEPAEGKRIAVGGLSGVVSVFEVGTDLGGSEGARAEEWDGVKRLVSRLEGGWL